MSNDRNFQVNLRGVIDLLSDHLYSGPQVYLRELLQNAVDAITARCRLDKQHAGEIKLEVIAAGETQPATLVVTDNGVGLTEDEVHQFLATIGQSSKRGTLDADDFIGQFGIGLLSGFVVSEEIVVITRSLKEGSKTVEWKGRADGTYSTRVLEHDFEPGTQVFLRAKPGCDEFFEGEFVARTARKYGCYLPYAMQVSWGDERRRINEDPPWRREYTSEEMQRDGLLEYGRELFESDFLDAIPLQTRMGGVDGVAFVLPYSSSLASKRTHRVYLKNMLLSEQVDSLLPEWAFFVKCVVNVTDLRPTAAREAFYEDENLAATREALGNALRRYLVQLARQDRGRLDRIIALHYLPIKALAAEDDDFYRMFIDWLPFESSLGDVTLADLKADGTGRGEQVLHYVTTRDQFRQIAGVAAAQSICIINTGYTYDTALIEKLPHVFPDRRIERVDVSEMAQSFENLSLDERDRVHDFLRLADLVLQPYRCAADIKKFRPEDLPTLYTANDSATFIRSVEQAKDVSDDLWSGVLDRIAEEPAADAFSQLCLNYRNPLIQKLAGLSNRELVQRSIEMLYVQALLLGHYPLKSQEMKLLSEGLLGLIELGVNSQ